MGTLFYFIKETLRGFVQAKLMTFVSIVTIAITLFFLGCMVVGFMNIRLWLGTMSKKANIVAYLDDTTYEDSAACDKLLEEIRGFSEVDSLYLVGKDEAWKEFEKQYGAEMLEAVDQNPLPARVDITLKKSTVFSEAVKSLGDKLREKKGVEGVSYSHACGRLTDGLTEYRLAEARLSQVPGLAQVAPSLLGTVQANQVRLLYEMQRYDEAVEKAGSSTSVHGTHFWSGCALFARASAEERGESRLEWFERAEAEFRTALTASPEDWDTKFNYELTRSLLKRLREEPETPRRLLFELLRPQAPQSGGTAPPRRTG